MLKIIFNSKDISREQSRYEYLPSEVDFSLGELMVGYFKPISRLFLNMPKNNGERDISVKYYSGTWQDVSGLFDLSFGCTRPGFLTWHNNQAGEKEVELNGQKMYWYKIILSLPETISFRGISTLFSDDFDLISVYPTIHNHLPEGQETFVRFHEEAAKDIITDLKRTGIVINGKLANNKERKQLDAFDLLDKEEVREAAKYFALSKIFAWLSDAPGDKWEVLADKYTAEAAGALTPLITIDDNNDGLVDDEEKAQPIGVYVGRL